MHCAALIPAIQTDRQKGRLRKQNMVTCHVFAETTHVVAAPLGFARVIAPAT